MDLYINKDSYNISNSSNFTILLVWIYKSFIHEAAR